LKKKIKVLHILEAVAGGTRKVVELQMKNLSGEDFEVSICIPTVSAIEKTRKKELNDPQFGESLRKDGFAVYEIAMLSEHLFSFANFAAIFRLYRQFKKVQCDIVHCSSSIAGFLGRISARLAGVTVIVYSPHGFSFFQNVSKIRYSLYLALEKIAGRITDAFIVSSIQEKEEARKLTKRGRILILENPIETDRYKPVANPGLKTTSIIGMVARLVPQKQPSDFVRMAYHLNAMNLNTEYILVGDGRLSSEVKDLAAELNVHNLTMLGNRKDYIEVMSTFDVFVMTSLWEGLPYAPIEALLLGIPTVLTDISGGRDLLEKYAKDWIVPLNSPKQIALVVKGILINYSLEKEKVSYIRKTIIERFDSKKIGEQLGRYYKELVNP
jgi:glycosyltransferase involved in cell wall biosynthesis